MGIVNVTPDSFYDGGKYSSLNDVLSDAEEKISRGAHIIDIGAASSRPNAAVISEAEEWDRLKNILPELRKRYPEILISVDTYRASIAERSAICGADLINDISGGNLDKEMFATITKLNLPYILTHMQGTPQNMQDNPDYKNVVTDIKNEFERKLEFLKTAGFEKIILDPGFGFGKTTENNYQLLKGIPEFTKLGFPVLAGMSRKAMINKVIGTNPVTALNGTTVLNTIALLNGASLLRVHDVSEARQAIELVEFYKNA
jgi:dihydropteroate synthase